MIKFDIYSKRFNTRLKSSMLCLVVVALCSCAKEEGDSLEVVENPILFGIEDIVQTKVTYGTQTNGGLSATFDVGENIGLYAYYNNFYYYYDEYESYAESVLFANQGLYITETTDEDSNVTYDAAYTPLRSWTFSTLYGTAPYTLDCVAYYPFESGYNPKYANLYHDDSGAATLEYYYVGYLGWEEKDSDEYVVNSNIDFMTAHTYYDDSVDADDFRSDMLVLDKIPFTFTRQTASLNLQLTKPDNYEATITVTGITVYFDAYTKFTQTIDGTNSKVSWEDMTTDYSLEANVSDLSVELEETDWDAMSDDVEGLLSYNVVSNLLEDDEMLFFPPDTEINKIEFTFKIGDDTDIETYIWHPHIATFVANAHYTLNLELNPDRAN